MSIKDYEQYELFSYEQILIPGVQLRQTWFFIDNFWHNKTYNINSLCFGIDHYR